MPRHFGHLHTDGGSGVAVQVSSKGSSKWSDSGVLKVCPAGFSVGLVTWYDIKVWGLK